MGVESLSNLYCAIYCIDALVFCLEIHSGDVKMVELVEVLGPWLTNPDKEERLQGTKLLAEVISLLSKDFLAEAECHFMSNFFCDRLKDHYSIVPTALSCLSSLVCIYYLCSFLSTIYLSW